MHINEHDLVRGSYTYFHVVYVYVNFILIHCNKVSLEAVSFLFYWLTLKATCNHLNSSQRTFYVSLNSLFREVVSIMMLGWHYRECTEFMMYVEVRFTWTSYNEEYSGLEIINSNFTLNFHLFLLVIPLFTNAVNSIRTYCKRRVFT